MLLAFVWLSLVLVKAFYKKRQLDQEIGSLKAEIAKTDKKGQELSQLLSYFNSDSYLEKEAKDKLNLKKEGENVVMVQEPAADQAVAVDNTNGNQTSPSTSAAPANDNNLVKWWKFFFKR